MKTLYEILEVSEKASKEVIEKAYKVLAKKYHPDLQKQEEKAVAEKKMKQINDAYDVLSDETKRNKYDQELEEKRKKHNEELEAKRTIQRQESINQKANINYQNQNETIDAKKMEKEIRQHYQKQYDDYIKRASRRVKHKWSARNFLDFLKAIAIMVIICAIIWILPPTRKFLIEFYESNEIIRGIIDVIGSIFTGIWNAICSIFTS